MNLTVTRVDDNGVCAVRGCHNQPYFNVEAAPAKPYFVCQMHIGAVVVFILDEDYNIEFQR